MIDDWKETGRHQMWVLQNAFEVVHWHDRHVGLLQKFGPLGSGAGLENARQFGVHGIDIAGAPGKRREHWVAAQIIAAGGLKEIRPLLVIVYDHADIAV